MSPIFRTPMFNILINLMIVILVIDAALLILVVLMQRPKSEGLGAAFGGGMTENLFGAQTSNVLATITRWLGGIFFGLTLLLSIVYARQSRPGGREFSRNVVKSAPAAAAVPAASAAPSPLATATATASMAPSPTAVPSTAPVAPAPSVAPTASASPAK